jgi:hypothetical protein
VVLAPNESQTVKVQLTKADLLTPGEYRSHLYFRAVDESKALGEPEQAAPEGIAIKMKIIYGVTIPVIVRIGEGSAQAKISDLSLQIVNDTIPKLRMRLSRTGNISVYGDLLINHISQQGAVTNISKVKGVAVYTPNAARWLDLDLSGIGDANLHSGKISVEYRETVRGNTITLTRAEMPLK